MINFLLSQISNDLISAARTHGRKNGPGCKDLDKPICHQTRLDPEKASQFEQFIEDKANIIMSSYKTDTKTGLPVKYLRDNKEALWEKFHATYPNGIQHTTFMKNLQGNQYIYKEDLGGLCSTCSRYGFEVFADIENFVKRHIEHSNLQVNNNISQ